MTEARKELREKIRGMCREAIYSPAPSWEARDMQADYLAESILSLLPDDADRLVEAEKVLRAIEDESVFNQQRYAEDTDTDYFLRCFGAVKNRIRAYFANHATHTETGG